MRKLLIVGGVLVALLVSAVGVVMFVQQSTEDTTIKDDTVERVVSDHQNEDGGKLADGRYVDYSESLIGDLGYDTTILFFYAPWCIECRGFDRAISDNEVPVGVQILKVDYDSSTDLRKKYGVTIQSTFVKVSGGGDKQKLWVGYGKDKTIDAVMRNIK